MNREIKFRAWIVPEKKMVPVFAVRFSDIGRVIEWLDPDAVGGHREVIAPQNQVLMQFTGLKDKNGKDVYEGDIINWEHGLNVGGARNSRGRSIVEWNAERCGFEEHEEFGGVGFPLGALIAVEIIGNIYQTPEFLDKP